MIHLSFQDGEEAKIALCADEVEEAVASGMDVVLVPGRQQAERLQILGNGSAVHAMTKILADLPLGRPIEPLATLSADLEKLASSLEPVSPNRMQRRLEGKRKKNKKRRFDEKQNKKRNRKLSKLRKR